MVCYCEWRVVLRRGFSLTIEDSFIRNSNSLLNFSLQIRRTSSLQGRFAYFSLANRNRLNRSIVKYNFLTILLE